MTAPPAAPVTSSSSLRPTARRAAGEVRVRLARYAERQRIEIAGADVATSVERRGARVVATGDVERDEFVCAPSRGPLRVDGRSYCGRIGVRASSNSSGLEVTNVVDLEDYVAGVVSGELVLWSSDLEALRAQAIASRSYAVAALDERGRRRADPYLFDDVRDQAYAGVLVPKSANERTLAAKLALAIDSTRGRVLLEGERVVDARFHAACGGTTADGRSIFPETDYECLRAVECAACRGQLDLPGAASSVRPWSWTASREELERLAREWKLGRRVVGIAATRSDASGRWLEVEVSGDAGSRRASFEELRRALGADKLPSSAIARTWPKAGETIENGLYFEGRGRGHGVGLCQEGARACAAAGWNAERILGHYYPGARVVDFR